VESLSGLTIEKDVDCHSGTEKAVLAIADRWIGGLSSLEFKLSIATGGRIQRFYHCTRLI
jgi:hypothetical protein